MRSFFTWLFFIFVILSAATFYYISSPQNQANISDLLPYGDSTTSLLEKIQQEILTPPPLTGSLTGTGGTLSINGILQETNKHRVTVDAAKLTLNDTLNKAAKAKVDDMFALQYFEHISPDGTGPADLADNVSYQYIRVGENLALGNYEDDTDLVQAWMDSPGHRANIMNKGYSEIGIAVGKGQYEEHNTWLAVQTFGLPASACPKPDPALQTSFDNKQAEANQLSIELDSSKQQLSTDSDIIKQLIAETKKLSEQGNEKIKAGNEQIEKGNEIAQDTGSQEEAQPYWDKGKKLQEEGAALAEQADTKQASAKELQTKLEQAQSKYNNQVNAINKLNENLKTLVNQLNKEIRAFNTCAQSP